MTHESFIMFYATQTDFSLDKYDVQTTSVKVMAYVNKVLEDQFKKYSLMTHMPMLVSYRLGMLVRNIVFYELFCLLAPEEINFDLFSMIRLRGCGLYSAYFSPCGTNKNYFRFF